jgi:AcrR family transcriptional regulator
VTQRPARGTDADQSVQRRRVRRDAEENRERLLAVAARVALREGHTVPMAEIAARAGVGVATLYRGFADREALLNALQFRAYGFLNEILDEVETRDLPGLDAVGEFLTRALAIADQLVLPLHGAPPLVSAEATAARQSIDRRLERFLERGRAERGIRAPINATDIIVFSALITRPLPHNPGWPQLAARQIANFLNGLAGSGPIEVPGPAVAQGDIEQSFAFTVRASTPPDQPSD